MWGGSWRKLAKDGNISLILPMMKKNPTVNHQLEEMKKKCAEMEANWKRAMADYRNLSARISEERKKIVRSAGLSLVDKLLTVMDDLERAVRHHHEQWLELIKNKLSGILVSEGVEKIEAKGDKFDPVSMDCAEVVAGAKNRVVEVVSEGYQRRGQVIRPARVKVGSGQRRTEPK